MWTTKILALVAIAWMAVPALAFNGLPQGEELLGPRANDFTVCFADAIDRAGKVVPALYPGCLDVPASLASLLPASDFELKFGYWFPAKVSLETVALLGLTPSDPTANIEQTKIGESYEHIGYNNDPDNPVGWYKPWNGASPGCEVYSYTVYDLSDAYDEQISSGKVMGGCTHFWHYIDAGYSGTHVDCNPCSDMRNEVDQNGNAVDFNDKATSLYWYGPSSTINLNLT